MTLYYTDHYTLPLPPGHKFPIAKYRLLREALSADKAFRFEPAPMAGKAVISLVHDPVYVDGFLTGTLDRQVMRRIGFPWSEELVKRTLASVGGTLSATEEAWKTGIGGTLAGGTHHAFRTEGSGFCVFNDIAVAIHSLRAANQIRKAAVLDLDVHQGDGTALIFQDDQDVLTVSVHGAHNFPFRKQRSRIDVDLPDGTGDAAYLAALERLLPEVFRFSPEIIFYQSGVDGLATDKLGRLSLTHAGLMERDRMVLARCKKSAIPVVITLGGGYSDPIEPTVEAHANTFRIAAGFTLSPS
ncbi:MAG: histone deacetylase [Acidobacteriota bacterium]|nr:histone deacetylase [Acidobacteriota bacterium]